MEESGKITSFFQSLPKGAPRLPIRWTATVELPKKRAKRGPGRPKKVREPKVIEIDPQEETCETVTCTNGGSEEEPTPRKAKRLYTLKQKKRVVVLARRDSIAAAVEHFQIPRTTINRWLADGYFDDERAKGGNRKGQGRPLTYDQATDETLLCWLLEARDLHLPVSRTILKSKAMELISLICPNFKASDGWVRQFMRRHSLVLRCRTSMAQELPATLEERIAAFHKQIGRVKEINNFRIIGNMDETPLFFDIVPNRVIASKGTKSVIVRTTGSEKRHLTATLSVTSEGDVLPALVIFKGKRLLNITAEGVFVRVQEKAWMDEKLMLEWIELVWEPATEHHRALLVLDSFSAHLTPAVKRKFKEINTVPVVIPGGCTSKVQPLDVCLNKPFKSYIRQYWSEYIIGESGSLAPHQKIKPPTKPLVASWVSDGLRALQEKPDMISHSFEACGITSSTWY